MRRADGPQGPDAALTAPAAGRSRHALLTAAALLAVLGAAAARFAPVPEASLRAREEALVAGARRALEGDVTLMTRLAEEIQRSKEFGGIVDAGGAEVRPARLFALLSAALPEGRGWGIVFLDAAGRAAAWAGEPLEIEEDLDPAGGGPVVSFHVARFTAAWTSVRVVAGERRGLLVVSRRYPTGVLRPDLVEFFSLAGGPTRLRLRAAAAAPPGRLVALSVERGGPGVAREDAARARARVPALLAAVLLSAAGARGRRPGPGLLAARLALLLGTPLAETGLWRRIGESSRFDFALLATPADIFLTGVLTLALLRLAWPGAADAPRGGERLALRLLLGIPLALLPFLLGHLVGETLPDLLDSMDLVPVDLADYLMQTGGVAVVTGSVGAAALLWSGVAERLRPRLFVLGGVFLIALSAFGERGGLALALAGAGAAALALALGARLRSEGRRDLLGRAATVAFLVAATIATAGAGLYRGKTRYIDTALDAADAPEAARSGPDAIRAWEERVRAAEREPWLPAGDRTLVSDLARVLWIRGAGGGFPGAGDLFRIRDAAGKVVSAFGLTRPGVAARGTLRVTRIDLPLSAEWVRVPWLREADRDPLLAATAEGAVPPPVLVDRLEYDAAGRAAGPRRADPTELPAGLRDEARARGVATGQVLTDEGLRRLRVRDRSPGFVTYVAPSESPLVSFGAAAAAGEAALPVVFALLLAGAARGGTLRRRGVPLLRTYRARLVALVVLFGALPLAGSVVVIRLALERHSARETERRALSLLAEGRRALEASESGVAGPQELNRAASVVGSDLFLYRDGGRSFASRAIPVSAEIAAGRLAAPVAEALAEGRREAASPALRRRRGGPRVVEAAETTTEDGRDALAVVVAEDEAARGALDGVVLAAVAVVLGAFGLGGRAALALGKPIEDLIGAADRIGSGAAPPPLETPGNVDLRRLVEAFSSMADRVRERTESLARERATAVGLLSNLTAAVLLFRRADGEVLLSNPAADQLLPGTALGERLAGVSWAPVRDVVEEAGRSGRLVERRVVVAAGGGRRVYRVVAMDLSPDASGPRSLLLLEDLTDFVRADRLGAWVDAARAVAHDVKNPLTPIRLAAERLLRLAARPEPPAGPTVEEAGANILRQVSILTDRIGRLARFSDPTVLQPRRLDGAALKALLTGVAADYAGLENVRLSVEAPDDLPPAAADPLLVRDALTNLVVNAVEAIGSRPGTVRLSAGPAPLPGGRPGVRFVCADDGPGLPPEGFERLFEPAFSTKSRGSGMGLATVRRAVERHGGAVFAEPSPGGGLTVGFVLPAL